MKALALYLAFVIATLPASANACSVPRRPFESDFPQYSQVYLGRVVSVSLTQYENQLRKARDSGALVSVAPYWGSSSLEHDVKILVTRVLKGDVEETVTLTLGGCGVHVPRAGDEALIFVQALGLTIPVYSFESEWFTEWHDKAVAFYRTDD